MAPNIVMDRHPEILAERRQGDPRNRGHELLIERRTGKMSNEETRCQEGEIHRKDSAHAAPVKHPEIVGRLARVEQYPADQETGKNKKKINPGPTKIRRADQEADNSGSAGVHRKVDVVEDNHQRDCYSS